MKTATPPLPDIREWMQPKTTDKSDAVFGGDMGSLLPPYSIIPAEFKDRNKPTPWNKVQSDWFHKGLPEGTGFIAKDGIEAEQAYAHLASIQASWAPKHEHKMAAVAWLMSLWFEKVTSPDGATLAP